MKISDILKKQLTEEGDDDAIFGDEWRYKVNSKMRDGDVDGMKRAAAPYIQGNILDLAMGARSEQVRLQASQFVLGQMGHGVVNRVEHTLSYEKMSEEQLASMVSSKLESIKRLNPAFDMGRLLPVLEGEVVESTEAVMVESAEENGTGDEQQD